MTDGFLDLDFVPPGASIIAMATHRLSRLLRSELGELLNQQAGLGLPAWRIFIGLASRGEITQKELVEFTKIEQAQISRSLTFMENDGLISSRRCDDDRRSRRFSLTDRGRAEYERQLPSRQRLLQHRRPGSDGRGARSISVDGGADCQGGDPRSRTPARKGDGTRLNPTIVTCFKREEPQ